MRAGLETARVRSHSVRRRAAQAAERFLRDTRVLPGEPPPRASFAGLPDSAPAGVSVVPAPMPGPSPYPPPKTVGREEARLQRAGELGPPARPAFVAHLRGGRVAGPAGVLITAGGEVLADTAWDAEQLHRTGLLSRHRLPPLTRQGGRLVTLVTLWSENYYHWLLDALPRLAVLAAVGEAPAPLLLPERLPRFAHETLALLDLPPDSFVYHRGGHMGADDLVWPSPAGHTGHPTPFAIDWLRSRLCSAAQAPVQGARRLYVTRSGVARGWSRRHVTNEDEVRELLDPLGFETVRPDTLTVAEQVRLFAESGVVVGAHGGWCANAMFSRSLTLVELFEPGYVNPCAHALAAACGHEYWYLMCDTRPVGDLSVRVADLERTLHAAGIA